MPRKKISHKKAHKAQNELEKGGVKLNRVSKLIIYVSFVPFCGLTKIERHDRVAIAQVELCSHECRDGPGEVFHDTHLRDHF